MRQLSAPAPPDDEASRPWYVPRALDGLLFRPFRYFLVATMGWNGAQNTQMLVRGYLVYQITGSFAALGAMSLAWAIPTLLLSPVGGVIADRAKNRAAVLQIGQCFNVVVALGMASLVMLDVIAYWHLFMGALAQGVASSLVMPSRQALLPEVVGMRRLMNAVPLQTAGMNVMQILTPTVGGFIIDWAGAEWAYVFIAVLFIFSVLTLFLVETLSPEELALSRVGTSSEGTEARSDDEKKGTLHELLEGLRYLRRDGTIRVVLSFTFLASVLGLPIRMLLPGYVAAVFGDEGSKLGLLQMGMGLGALAGALLLASLGNARRRGRILVASAVVIGISMFGLTLTSTLWIAWVALAFVGIGSSGRQALSQVLVQEYVEDAYRGRVMAIYMMQFSLMAVGTFAVSLYMESAGAEFAMASVGVALVLASLVFVALVPRLRRLD